MRKKTAITETRGMMDALQSAIQDQQAAMDALESSKGQLEFVVESLLKKQDGHTKASQPPRGKRPALSHREMQVLRLLVEGKSSKQIAAELGISFKTAVTHRASIMSKMNLHEVASVVREAIRLGLVP